MAMGRRIVTSLPYGLAFGTLFYIIGGVAQNVFPSITPELAAALGFTAAVTINLAEKEYKEQKQA
ncbi:hypothetical protein X802_08470 [Thermococcus guaymasensis DSM 11113]|uniref:Uncharacterized protein n=1 Tax=Thermococcus guaymasensis DSM 11113 TaxID=1432656 RepID=A0A0X1KNG3_9EURY|nr:hypothetical protein [Thermococcus guaymasensis]AJC72799.1 hypothetical protein X802_08470 [Thermococcus guaymasensis DSM 11113]